MTMGFFFNCPIESGGEAKREETEDILTPIPGGVGRGMDINSGITIKCRISSAIRRGFFPPK